MAIGIRMGIAHFISLSTPQVITPPISGSFRITAGGDQRVSAGGDIRVIAGV